MAKLSLFSLLNSGVNELSNILFRCTEHADFLILSVYRDAHPAFDGLNCAYFTVCVILFCGKE